MKYSAMNYSARSISANQLDALDSVFVMARSKIEDDYLWISDKMKVDDYEVFINPRIVEVGEY